MEHNKETKPRTESKNLKKDGMTREINIKDSIGQGSVLSVLQYAKVMDDKAKYIKHKKQYRNKNTKEQHQNRMLPVDG